MTQKVLLVDDDKLMREGLGASVTEAGYEIVEASDGKEGLATALAQHPDIIVADIRMPEMDGITMVEQLRKDDWGKSVPVIIMSTDDTTERVNEALAIGVTIYLEKTVLTPQQLVAQIQESLA